jgi:hypothetical protein
MTAAALDAVPAEKAGMASGALRMTRMVGATFGVATSGALFQALERRSSHDAFATGLTGAMALCTAVAALGAVLVFFLGRRGAEAPDVAPAEAS